MTKKVFYWKKPEYLIDRAGILEVDKNDFRELPVTFKDSFSNERIFKLLNKDKTPLTTKEMQKWLEENLQPFPHTSMSVGDIIEHNDKLVMCEYGGWREVKWK